MTALISVTAHVDDEDIPGYRQLLLLAGADCDRATIPHGGTAAIYAVLDREVHGAGGAGAEPVGAAHGQGRRRREDPGRLGEAEQRRPRCVCPPRGEAWFKLTAAYLPGEAREACAPTDDGAPGVTNHAAQTPTLHAHGPSTVEWPLSQVKTLPATGA